MTRTQLPSVDVVVVGGGPAGLYSAAQLAQSGIRVMVLEEHPSAGTPVHCTGVLFSDAFDELGLSRSVILNELCNFTFHAPCGYAFDFATDTAEAVVVDRVQLDRQLVLAAHRADVLISESQRVRDIVIDSAGVTVYTDRNEVHAEACILACGANYTFQRKFGLGKPVVYMQSAQVEVPAKCRDSVDLYFGSDIAPGGFAWVVPVFRGKREHVRVGLMCERAAGKFFSRFMQRIAKRWEISEAQSTPRRKILPLSPIHKTYADRLLVVGDAAGLVKPTTGGGIYFSLISAKFAADVLREAYVRRDFSESQLQRYELLWQRRLGPEIEAQLAIRHLAQRLPDAEIDEFFQLTRDRGVTKLIRTFARFNDHRDLILAVLRHPPTRDILQQAWQV